MEWVPIIGEIPLADENGDFAGTKKHIFDYHPRFTEEERNELLKILNKFPKEKVEIFINLLLIKCNDYRIFLKQNRKPQIRREITDALPVLKKALRQIKCLQNIGELGERLESVPRGRKNGQKESYQHLHLDIFKRVMFDVPILLSKSEKYLDGLISVLEEVNPERPNRGRPSTEGGFAQAVNDIFTECFEEEPSKWREGILSQILKICLNGMGLKSEDPERRLKSIRHK